VNDKNAVSTVPAIGNFLDQARNVKMDFVNVQATNAFLENVKNTLIVLIQATNMAAFVTEVNASFSFPTHLLVKCREHVTVTNIVLLA